MLMMPTIMRYAFKVKKKDFYLPYDKSFLVDCSVTTHIVNYHSNLISIDDNFNPEGHFIELADGMRSNNVAKKGMIVISLRTKEGNLVKVTLENTLFIPT